MIPNKEVDAAHRRMTHQLKPIAGRSADAQKGVGAAYWRMTNQLEPTAVGQLMPNNGAGAAYWWTTYQHAPTADRLVDAQQKGWGQLTGG